MAIGKFGLQNAGGARAEKYADALGAPMRCAPLATASLKPSCSESQLRKAVVAAAEVLQSRRQRSRVHSRHFPDVGFDIDGFEAAGHKSAALLFKALQGFAEAAPDGADGGEVRKMQRNHGSPAQAVACRRRAARMSNQPHASAAFEAHGRQSPSAQSAASRRGSTSRMTGRAAARACGMSIVQQQDVAGCKAASDGVNTDSGSPFTESNPRRVQLASMQAEARQHRIEQRAAQARRRAEEARSLGR